MDILEILGKVGFDTRVFLFNLINFAIIAALLWKFFFSKMIKNIETRQQEIEQGLQDAEAAKSELAMAKQKGDELINEAKKEANGIVRESVETAKTAASKVRAEADAEIDKLREKSKAQIAEERERMISEFKSEASDLVVLATRKLLGEKEGKTDPKDAEKVLSGLTLSNK
jgi:F-type H+-transporting ATPase subunit b